MPDTGQDVEIGDSMTVTELIALEAETDKRFSFNMDPSGKFATVYYVNYYKTAGGNRVKNKDGAYRLLDHVERKVVVR